MRVRSESEDVKRVNLHKVTLLVNLLFGVMSLRLRLIQVCKCSVRPWVGTAGARLLGEVEGIIVFSHILFVQIRFYGNVSHGSVI